MPTNKDTHTIIQISPITQVERKRKRTEFLIGVLAFILIVGITTLALSLIGVESVLFFVLLNINILLLALVLFLVVRNGIKLLLERRRGVIGSRLRTRLVVTFMLLSLIPTTMMFIASTRAVQSSVDYWFRNRIDSYIQMALGVGAQYVDGISGFLKQQSNLIAHELSERKLQPGSSELEQFLREREQSQPYALIGIISADGSKGSWSFNGEADLAWQDVQTRINWADDAQEANYRSVFQPGQDGDYIFAVQPLPLSDENNAKDAGKDISDSPGSTIRSAPASAPFSPLSQSPGPQRSNATLPDAGRSNYYLILSLRLDQGTLYRLDSLARASSEYRDLKELRRPFKTTFYFFLALIALIITLGAMWVGFRLSKQLSQPLQALMDGTERIAKGDLSIRFDDSGADEIALLIQSFNRMTDDLEQSRQRITASNEKLEERTNYIETVLNSIAAGVISLDADEKIGTVNKAACAIFNLKPEDFIGKHPSDLLRGKQALVITQLLEQIRRSPGLPQQRQMNVTLQKREWRLLITATALVGADGSFNGVVAIFEDVTDLEKAQRMAAWREVARRIAHEIKNPLTPIKLSAQRLERKFGEEVSNPSFTQCTRMIVSQVEQLQQMVEEFSSFAKLPEVTLRRDNLASLLEELHLLFANSHSSINWGLQLDPGLPEVDMDRAALHRVFMNILANAADALRNRENGQVTMAAAFKAEQGVVQIEISDNGTGLDSEELDRLFEPYFSKKKDGTGLGLTIVKSIIKDHRGYVRARNGVDSGAVITVELPVAEE
ncbi:MAG: HAMP domain-containing protein [Desulfovibrionaceae bacterium]|nr:HAMP domain-containing protein [Desulfovibrionaceae bacterium]